MSDKDREIKEWIHERARTRVISDEEIVNGALKDCAVFVLAQFVKSDSSSTEWVVVEPKSGRGVFPKEMTREISKKLSKMSRVMQVVTLELTRCDTKFGPKWGYPIADQRAEKIG